METLIEPALQFYKYRSLNGEYGIKTAEDIILHNRLFWQSPSAFNDPFDCGPSMVLGGTAGDKRKFTKDAAHSPYPNASRAARRMRAKAMTSESLHRYEADMIRAFKGWMESSALTCFSKVPDSLLMWAHYADSHRGVCFVFEESMTPEPLLVHDVVYRDERPLVDLTRINEDEQFRGTLLTKGICWSYESEVRMFEYRKPPGYRSFPAQCLTGVVLGSRVSDEHRACIESLIARRKQSHLRLFKAQLSDTRFGLSIGPI
jgi:hypothetical protein